MNTSSLLGFAIALVVAALVVFPGASALRKHPTPFYAAALVLTAVYVWGSALGGDLSGAKPLLAIMQKGYLATIFLGVVMFTGVLNEGSALRKHLQPVRGELSILSFIFILGHIFTYLPGYLPRFGSLVFGSFNVAGSLFVAIILTLLFAVLTITSVRAIRQQMDKKRWKTLQRGAYVMVALLAVHVFLVLGASAFQGGFTQSTITFIAYLVVIALYAILRIRKGK